jgi:hypothetical protein
MWRFLRGETVNWAFFLYPNISYWHVKIDWRSADTRISSNGALRRLGSRGVVSKKYSFLIVPAYSNTQREYKALEEWVGEVF